MRESLSLDTEGDGRLFLTDAITLYMCVSFLGFDTNFMRGVGDGFVALYEVLIGPSKLGWLNGIPTY